MSFDVKRAGKVQRAQEDGGAIVRGGGGRGGGWGAGKRGTFSCQGNPGASPRGTLNAPGPSGSPPRHSEPERGAVASLLTASSGRPAGDHTLSGSHRSTSLARGKTPMAWPIEKHARRRRRPGSNRPAPARRRPRSRRARGDIDSTKRAETFLVRVGPGGQPHAAGWLLATSSLEPTERLRWKSIKSGKRAPCTITILYILYLPALSLDID